MRNRHISQSDALFVSNGTSAPTLTQGTGVIKQLNRVQSANYGGQFNRVDVNQFGQLGKIDSLVLDSPTFTLDYEYFIHNGYNEAAAGFSIGSDFSTPFLSGQTITDTGINSTAAGAISGRNYFILSTPEGTDANFRDISAGSGNSIISIGNAWVTDYNVSAAVGSIPSATITVEGFNGACTAYTNRTGRLPAVDSEGERATGSYTLPTPGTGSLLGATALRPGDIVLSLGDSAILTDLEDSAPGTGAHIQSFSISVPIGRSTLQRLGSNYGYAKEIDFPVNIDVSVSALVADLKEGSVDATLQANAFNTLTLTLRGSNKVPVIAYQIKGCQVVSENFSSAIGSNKTVDISFTSQVAGPGDTSVGLFVSGAGAPFAN